MASLTTPVNAALPSSNTEKSPQNPAKASFHGKEVSYIKQTVTPSHVGLKILAVVLIVVGIAALLSALTVSASLLFPAHLSLLNPVITPIIAAIGTAKWTAIAAGITAFVGLVHVFGGSLLMHESSQPVVLLTPKPEVPVLKASIAPTILYIRSSNGLEKTSEWNLRDKNLYEFPECLCAFSDTSKLDLSRNHLESISPAIGNMVNLTDLSVSENQNLKFLPSEIARLPHLDALRAENCGLTALPDFANPKLRALNVSQNQLSHLPGAIGLLPKLEGLRAHNNKLTDLPLSFADLKKVTLLDLSSNNFKTFPEEICEMSALEVLHLSRNEFTEIP
jgi:Leucine-rich repeat (LRR) protein